MPREVALTGLRQDGWKFFAPVPRIAEGNRKEHCADSFDCLWVDVDREPGADPDSILADLRSLLQPLDVWPTALVFSGNRGVHAYWKLGDDLPIEQIEAYNRALAHLVGGDSCHDRTHIFRHPGTVNEKSGRLAEIIEIGAEVIPVDRLDHLGPVHAEPDAPRVSATPSTAVTKSEPQKEEWLRAAEALNGWQEPADVDLRGIAEWEKEYMFARPAKGWKRHRPGCLRIGKCDGRCKSRSDVEQSLVYRVAGKQFGGSDRQIREIADHCFARHREEVPKQGYRYIDRCITKARRQHYDKGWITSPIGGPPRKRNPKYRWATTDDLELVLGLVHGGSLPEWVAAVKALGFSKSSAYRWKGELLKQELVVIEDGKMHSNTLGAVE
jgi:hypothetical protein